MAHDCANTNWKIDRLANNNVTHEDAKLATLMDIREELKAVKTELVKLNALLHCSNFTAIPAILRTIRRNTTKRRRKKSPPSP